MSNIHPGSIPLPILHIRFSGHLAPWEVPALRGAIGHKVGADAVLFHHHQGENLRYAYPLIQYKSSAGRPAIVCLGEGVNEIYRFFSQPDWSVQLSGRDLPMKIEHLNLTQACVQVVEKHLPYQLWHWVALNQHNAQEFQQIDGLRSKIEFLEKKLIGNILAFAKGIGWHIDQPLQLEIIDFQEARPVKLKQVSLRNFHVQFRCNVSLPFHIGLGGKVSVGMGEITEIPSVFQKAK